MIEKATQFGRYVHRNQTRKGSGDPYYTHTEWVANRIRELGGSELAIVVALLHDSYEDQEVPLELLAALFSPDVATGVWWVSDVSRPSDGNRKVRKAKDRAHYGQAPIMFKNVKLVDSVHNLNDIMVTDPGFAPTYFREKQDLLEVLLDGNAQAVADMQNVLGSFFNR